MRYVPLYTLAEMLILHKLWDGRKCKLVKKYIKTLRDSGHRSMR